jgi:hypothetical protein
MRDWTTLRERYVRDDLPTRLGGLAANLARISSFSKNPINRNVVHSLVDESKFFIEWMAADAGAETAAPLVELQVQLALWQLDWDKIWDDPDYRGQVVDQSRAWSDKVLDLSGLLS